MGVREFRARALFIKKFPQLEDAMPPDVDEYGNVPVHLAKLRETMHELNAEIAQQRLDTNVSSFNSTTADRGTSLQRNVASSYSMREIKEHLPRDMHEIHKLWDPSINDFTHDPVRDYKHI